MEYFKNFTNFLDRYHYNKNHFYVFLLLITIVNIIIKLMFLGSETLYMDEPYSIFTAQQSLTEIYNQCLHDSNPPLYLFILHFWMHIFGISAFSAKLLSVFASIGTAVAVAIFAKRFLNPQSAVLASILFLFTNALLYYSHEARTYSMVIFSVVLSFYVFLSTLKNPTKLKLALLVLINVVLLFLHYTSIFVHITQLVISFLFIKTNKKGFIYYVVSQFLAMLIFLPWMKIVIENTPTGETWFQSPTLAGLYYVPAGFTNSPINFILFVLVIIFSVYTILAKKSKIFKNSFDVKIFYTLLFWYLLPVIFNFIVSQYFPVYYLKTVLYSSIGFILLMAYIISSLNINRVYLLIISVIILVIPLTDFRVRQFKPEDWNVLIPKVKSIIDDKTIVLVTPWWQTMPFSYYYDVEIFKQYNQVGEIFKNKNILFINDSSNLKNVDFNIFNKIIVVKCRPPFDNTQEFIEKRGYEITGIIDNSDSKAYVFTKSELLAYTDSSEMQLIINQLIWNKKKLISKTSDNELCIYSSNFEQFDSINSPPNITNLNSQSGKYSCVVNKKYEYGSTLEIELASKYGMKVYVSFYAFANEIGSPKMVYSISRMGKDFEWKSQDIKFEKNEVGKWTKFKFNAVIDKETFDGDFLKVYVWNPSEYAIYIDDIEVVIN